MFLSWIHWFYYGKEKENETSSRKSFFSNKYFLWSLLLHIITNQYIIKTGNNFNHVVFLDFETMKFQKNVEIITQILRFFKNSDVTWPIAVDSGCRLVFVIYTTIKLTMKCFRFLFHVRIYLFGKIKNGSISQMTKKRIRFQPLLTKRESSSFYTKHFSELGFEN